MNFKMATKSNSSVDLLIGTSTDFVMHVLQTQPKKTHKCIIIDFTEKKLVKYALSIKDAQQQLVIMALVKDYVDGFVAVAWKSGKPVPIRVVKD